MAEAGSVAPVFRDGGYDATATYDFYHAIIHNNKLYFCRQDGTIGHEPQEETDEYWFLSLDGNIADAVTLNGKAESELSVANAEALGGKGASEYALAEQLEVYTYEPQKGNTETEINNIYDSMHSSITKNYTHYTGIIHHNMTHSKLGAGFWFVEGVFITSLYGYQKTTRYNDNPKNNSFERYMYNGTWTEWTRGANTADLANYLPKTGGTLTGNELWLRNGYSRVNSDSNGSYLQAHDNPHDENNRRCFVVANSTWAPDIADALRFFEVKNGQMVKVHHVLHTGNKPSGTYTGNGSATQRKIATGGIGKAVIIWSSTQISCATVYPSGYQGQINGTAKNSSDVTFDTDGNIVMNTADAMFNASGVTYGYSVI